MKNQTVDLKERIILLQNKRALELILLKNQFHRTCQSLKPMNLVKSMFKETISSPNLKDNILNTSIGLAAGYISKLLFVNVSHSPLRKILGFALQFGMTRIVAKNPEGVKTIAKGIVNTVKTKLTHSVNGRENNDTK